MSKIEIIDYSERAIALFGDTKNYKDAISSIGGKANPSLQYKDGERKFGWIFPKSKRDVAQQLVNDINNGKINISVTSNKTSGNIEQKSYKTSCVVSSDNKMMDHIDKKTFLALLSRVEKLEQELCLLKQQNGIKTVSTQVQRPVIEFCDDEEECDESEEEEECNRPRMLRRK
jgi:hypothetical protein